jgi:hypothetical protein
MEAWNKPAVFVDEFVDEGCMILAASSADDFVSTVFQVFSAAFRYVMKVEAFIGCQNAFEDVDRDAEVLLVLFSLKKISAEGPGWVVCLIFAISELTVCSRRDS